MPESLEAQVLAALAAIRNPRVDNDLLSAGMIRDLAVTDEGGVVRSEKEGEGDPALAGDGEIPDHAGGEKIVVDPGIPDRGEGREHLRLERLRH